MATQILDRSFNFQHVPTTSNSTRHAHAPERCRHIGTSGGTAVWPIGKREHWLAPIRSCCRSFGGLKSKMTTDYINNIQESSILVCEALKRTSIAWKGMNQIRPNGEDKLRGNKHHPAPGPTYKHQSSVKALTPTECSWIAWQDGISGNKKRHCIVPLAQKKSRKLALLQFLSLYN